MEGKEGKKEDKIEEKEITEYLCCVLSDAELLEKSRELAKSNNDLVSVGNRKKEVTADFAAKEKKLEANIGVLSTAIAQGKEWRDVKCKQIIDYAKGIKTITRMDTYEIVKTDFLTQGDRQVTLHA